MGEKQITFWRVVFHFMYCASLMLAGFDLGLTVTQPCARSWFALPRHGAILATLPMKKHNHYSKHNMIKFTNISHLWVRGGSSWPPGPPVEPATMGKGIVWRRKVDFRDDIGQTRVHGADFSQTEIVMKIVRVRARLIQWTLLHDVDQSY